MRSWRAVFLFWAFILVMFGTLTLCAHAEDAQPRDNFNDLFDLMDGTKADKINDFCAKPLDPAVQPTPEEIIAAAQYVGLKSLPAAIWAIPQDCMGYEIDITLMMQINRYPYLGLTYMHFDFVLLWDGWRRTEDQTILVHELRHQWQSEHGLAGSECDSTDFGSAWAAEHGNVDGFIREMLYGLPHCVGGDEYDPDDYAVDTFNPNTMKLFGFDDTDWNVQFWKDTQ